MKRIFLFVATNVAILLVLSVTLRLLGVDQILNEQGGIDFNSLLIFSAVVGFTGSLISLAMSKFIAKQSMGVRVIEQPSNPTELWLVETVRKQAQTAGIGMPEVGIFDAPDMNAFATGANRNNALVAVSSGLLRGMSQREAEAVLAHEVSHVANGDMVTLTLIQGVVNTFVVFLSRVIGFAVDRFLFNRGDREGQGPVGHGPAFMITTIVAQLVLGILASMIVMWFSRHREFRADAGGANLAGRENMIGALERLRHGHATPLPDSMQALGISSEKKPNGLARLFMTHPPLEERIAALRQAA